jgi:endoglucanase
MIKCCSSFLIVLILSGLTHQIEPEITSEKMSFWQTQKKGANMNLTSVRTEWFEAAHKVGLQFIRFNVSWFLTDNKDFLIGDTDNFTHISQKDLEVLLEALDAAESNHQKIILIMFELPGCKDGNADGTQDYRIWHNESYQKQAFLFWKELASAVKDHPAIVAYDPLNEPHPEREYGLEEPGKAFIDWLDEIKGTVADLNRFNKRMVASIRETDPETPIMLEGYFYAGPEGLPYMEVIDDPSVLYSFHNPGPWQFTTFRANKGRYRYPDNMPEYWDDPGSPWTVDNLIELLEPVKKFMADNNINANQIVASEVLCDRRVEGCAEYLKDLFSLYNKQNWHWAFYAFRADDAWTGLDYEIGTEPDPAGYWEKVENGADYNMLKNDLRHENPLWSVIQKEFPDLKGVK